MSTVFRNIFYCFILLLWLVPVLFGQNADSDSSQIKEEQTLAPKPNKSGMDTTVTYEAMIVENLVPERRSVFTGNAVVKYKNIVLKAEKISIDWDKHLMEAEGLPDTVWSYNEEHTDSSQKVITKGSPILVEGGSEMTGTKMLYNYETEKGRVVRGRTELEGGFYEGQQIKRIDGNTFNVSHSSFTTCDQDSNPHFHFESRRLKMIPNDKVVSGPVVMYIGNIPVAALPFAVFPHQSGRHSGLIVPTYGQSSLEGRYLRGLGYYWAPSEYYDARFMVDFFERSGWFLRAGSNYSVRYLLNGSIDGSLTRKNFQSYSGTESKERRWDLRLRHNQELSPTSKFTADGYFVSDENYYQDLSSDFNTRLTSELRSNATYSKSWPQKKLSLSVNMSRVQNLESGLVNQTYPQMSFRLGQTQLFKSNKEMKRKSRQKSQKTEDKWYNSLYFSYSSNLINSKNESFDRYDQKKTDDTRKISNDLNFSLTSPKKYFGWLSLNQSLHMDEDWFLESNQYKLDSDLNTIEQSVDKGFVSRHTFNYNASANTKLYGLFLPGIGDIQAIRHVVTPSLSFRYQPNFSDSKWGYYKEIQDTTGSTIKRDRFGGTPSSGVKSLNMSVRNLFQMKQGYGENETKVDLFTMDMSSGFNFEAAEQRLSNLSTSWRANPGRNFSLSASTTHSFYQWDSENSMQVNKYLFDDGDWKKMNFMRLTNLNLNFSLRLQGQGGGGSSRMDFDDDVRRDEQRMPGLDDGDPSVLEEDMLSQSQGVSQQRRTDRLNIPWRVNLNFNFSLNKFNPNNPIKNYYLQASGAEVKLTKNWRIGYSARYDLEQKSIVHHSFRFFRDLHCWEAQVDWVPSGLDKRIYFRINIKSQVLQDIKLEKRGGRASSALGY